MRSCQIELQTFPTLFQEFLTQWQKVVDFLTQFAPQKEMERVLSTLAYGIIAA